MRELFSENLGDVSMMRLMSLICVIASVIIAITGLYWNRDLMGITTLCLAFLTTAFGGKIWQKKIESSDK